MKIVTTTLTMLFLAAVLQAQSPLEMKISHDLDMDSGATFEVELRASNFVDLYTIQLFLTWDEDLYRINDVTYTNDALPSFDNTNIVLPQNDVSIPDPGKVRVVWADAAPANLPDDTHLVTFSFTVLGQPCEVSEFTFDNIGTEESEMLLATGSNFQNVGVNFESKNIMIPGVGCVSSADDLAIENNVSVYPNPVVDYLKIEFENNQIPNKTKVTVMDLTGKEILDLALNSHNNSVDLSTLVQGAYLYSIHNREGVIRKGQIYKVK